MAIIDIALRLRHFVEVREILERSSGLLGRSVRGSLLDQVPCVPRANAVCVSTCLRASGLHANVLACQRGRRAIVPACQRANKRQLLITCHVANKRINVSYGVPMVQRSVSTC